MVQASPGEYVAVVRRKGSDWWLGAVTNVDARKLEVPLDFLPPDAAFTADIYEDAGEKTIAKRSVPVTRETRLGFDLRPSGGAAIHLRAKQ